MWGGSVERSCGPMNKNRIEGVADQGERASNRETLVINGKRRRSGGRAVKECVLTWGDLASLMTSTSRTARCGPACRVVWQGCDPKGRPYADLYCTTVALILRSARRARLEGCGRSEALCASERPKFKRICPYFMRLSASAGKDFATIFWRIGTRIFPRASNVQAPPLPIA